MSLFRPSPRRLSAALVLLGVLAGVAFLVVPVDAGFSNDPLLRLQAFGSGSSPATTGVDCGAPLANLRRRGDGLSLYSLAKDRACRSAASRRAATAVAAGGVLGLLGALGLTGARAGTRQLAV
jgi:hypothetical protein